jgi:hypothetical protein
MMRLWRSIFFIVLCGGYSWVFAGELSMQSGPQQAVMIELYTSEGCNSCPPAERFLNDMVDNDQLWTTYFPLAFHVDYWDYLGWRDRFASHANSQRQRVYGKVLQARTIYTPEFFVNGREWRRGFFGGMPSVTGKQVGVLKAMLQDSRLTATFAPRDRKLKPTQLHVAILGMGLPSDIRAGENAGRRTTHQFVVLAHTQETSDTLHWHTTLPRIGDQQPKRRALVVWVSESANPTPMQVTGGFLPR